MKKAIKTSYKGVPYAEPKILYDGPRVYSQAILMKINHNDTSKIDIELKIGRYNVNNKKPISDNPKSELTLKNSELEALIQYINENYTPLTLGEGEYINVESDNVDLVSKFRDLLNDNDEAAQFLLDNQILTDNTFSAASFIRKVKSLKEFERELSNDLSESFWQKWFEDNKWILGSDFAKIVDERQLDTENVADYIMQAYDGFVDLVEIKKPNNMQFWASSKDHDNYVPSSVLVKAITQCLNYLYAIERESNSLKFSERIGSKVIKPRCTLIFGRSNDWDDEKKEAFRILNSAYKQITILSYDHLLDRAKTVLGISNFQEDENEDLPF